MNKNKLVGPKQAHSAGGIVSDKLMEWNAIGLRVQEWMDNPKHPLWSMMRWYLATTLQTLIEAGKYQHVKTKYVNETNFPPETLQFGLDPRIYTFKEQTPEEAGLAIMSADGYRPGTMGDLLLYAINHRREIVVQKCCNIIAVGSLCKDEDPSYPWPSAPCLGHSTVIPFPEGISLNVMVFGKEFAAGPTYQYLAVRQD